MVKILRIMEQIQRQKAADIAREGLPPLTLEVKAMAARRKFTIDYPPALAAKKADPLR